MASDPNQILSVLLSERGGSGAFDVVQLAAARQLAGLLASDAAVGNGIAALVQLLPPVVREKTEPVNLERLSDHELDVLEHLVAKGQGKETAAPVEPPASHREAHALELARVLDGLEGDDGEVRLSTADERNVRNLLSLTCRGLVLRRLFGIE